MMGNYGEEAAKRAAQREQEESNRRQRSRHEAHLKQRLGPELFERLNQWLTEQLTAYNKLRPGNELIIGRDEAPRRITVRRQIDLDARTQRIKVPLTFTYLPDQYKLLCESHKGRAEYSLSVSAKDEVRFIMPPEEIAEQFLTDFVDSPLVPREHARPPHSEWIPRHI
jgi:hypothetical protein